MIRLSQRFGVVLVICLLCLTNSACDGKISGSCENELSKAAQLTKEMILNGIDEPYEERKKLIENIQGEIDGCELSDAVIELHMMEDLDLNHMYLITKDLNALKKREKHSLLSPKDYQEGRDPLLHWASLWSDRDSVEYLISIGFDPDRAEISRMEPPVFHAADHIFDDPGPIGALIDAGADLDVSGRGDIGILAAAVISGNVQVATALLDYGMCPKEKDADGKTSMDLALEQGLDELAEKMQQAAAENCG